MDNLDAQQLVAVKQPIEDNVFVLAGAGSGKTLTLTMRICELLASGVPEKDIIALTFTKDAAYNMKNRVQAAVQSYEKTDKHNVKDIFIGTFHGYCLSLVSHVSVIDDVQSLSIVEMIINKCGYSVVDASDALRAITLAKDHCLMPDSEGLRDYFFTLETNVPYKAFVEIYKHYQQWLVDNKTADFAELQYMALCALKDNPPKNKWVLVDEFQDINHIQYEFIKAVAKCVFGVGDDDQSIYSFRGCTPKYIHTFMKDYNIENPIILSTNYRSFPTIVALANKAVEHNKDRIHKDMRPIKTGGTGTYLYKSLSVSDECLFVAKQVQRLKKLGAEYKDIAVLARTSYGCKEIEATFASLGIPGAYYKAEDEHTFMANTVTLMTVHGAKGLEFEHVFMVGCDDGSYPFYKTPDRNECARIFFVGLTRAKQTLFVSYPQKRTYSTFTRKCKITPFLTGLESHFSIFKQ